MNYYNMRTDLLRQYAKLRKQLTEEKSQLEARLAEINEVLGSESTSSPVEPTAQVHLAKQPRRGRRTSNTMSMREAVLKALSKGPLARKEIVQAVEDVGYKFTTKNPLNSIGAVLYGKNSPVTTKDGKFCLAEGVAIEKAENNGTAGTGAHRRKKRRMSPEARAKIAEAQRARWAKVKRSK